MFEGYVKMVYIGIQGSAVYNYDVDKKITWFIALPKHLD